ncbi:hypothetical protein D3C78_1654530 [compost metagenome]
MNHQAVCKNGYIGTFANNVSFAKLNSVFTVWNFSTERMVQIQMLHEEYRIIVTDCRDQQAFSIIRI